MGFDSFLYYKACVSLGSKDPRSIGYIIANQMQMDGIKAVELYHHEQMDFVEFLQTELGDEYKELRRKFELEYYGEELTYDENLNLIEL